MEKDKLASSDIGHDVQDLSVVDLNTDEPVTITFEELSYSVRFPVKKLSLAERIKGLSLSGFPRTEWNEKYLLQDLTGTIKPNTMTALMGPSGAGKSTLLDVLAQRKNTGRIEGEILVNGKPPGRAYKRLVGYVEQKDFLLATLTPNQLLYYTARLRLPASCSKAFIEQRVHQVIDELGLQKCQDTIIGNAVIRGISGGQAKRVNIGVELITDPRVLFLDEPTTGLDSSTALEVMMVMRELTNRGRTTIATIHQPSTDTFNLFDKLFLLVDGRAVYLGDAAKAVPFYQSMGFVHPEGMNPADFLIGVVGGGTGHGDKLVEGPDMTRAQFVDAYTKSALASERLQSTAMHKNLLARKKTIVDLDGKPKEPPQFINSALHNFRWIYARNAYSLFRDRKYWLARFFRIAIVSFLVATVFHSQPHTDAGVYNIFSVMNYGTMIFGFGALGFAPNLIERRMYFQRERQSASYQVSAFYLAEVFTEWPAFFLQTVLWTAVIYPTVGLRADVGAVFCFWGALFMSSEVGYAVAMFGSYFGADLDEGTAVVLPILMLSFMFSGFFIQAPQIPPYWIWAYYLSYLQYTLSIFAMNQWPPGEDDGWVKCQGDFCTPWTNDEILTFWGTGPAGVTDQIWVSWLALFALYIFWRAMGYLALRFKRHDKR